MNKKIFRPFCLFNIVQFQQSLGNPKKEILRTRNLELIG